MWNTSINNRRGFTLIEVLIALVLIMTGILGVLSVFPSGWQTNVRAERIGRAAQIMSGEMATLQLTIMNSCNAVPTSSYSPTVYSSGRTTAQPGDASFMVTRTVQTAGANAWLVTVQVTWTGNPTGIQDSSLVVRDDNYKQGC